VGVPGVPPSIEDGVHGNTDDGVPGLGTVADLDLQAEADRIADEYADFGTSS
jgi:hypothetical protein